MEEQITENIFYDKGYDKGFSDAQEKLARDFDRAYERGYSQGFQRSEYQNKWIKIEDQTPKEDILLLYFFEGTGGAFLGFYFGIDENYCPETGHTFGSPVGFLTGDVTHWMYVPEYPKGFPWVLERQAEWLKEVKRDIKELKTIKRYKK